MAIKKKALQAAAGAAGGAEALAIEDVFSTYLYTGTGITNTITNGIDLAGEGGMVWLKARSLAQGHTVTDTERGSNFVLQPNTTDAQVNTGSLYVSSFNSDGFSIGTGSNTFSQTFASWTFRKAPRFFDVVTYTGDGTTDGSKTIAHNLGTTVGSVIIKGLGNTFDWRVWHRNDGSSPQILFLNQSYPSQNDGTILNVNDASFSVAYNAANQSGIQYVAYLFAHDPLGPSGDGSDGLIACGSYTGNGSATGPVIDLGWEPQWVMIKETTNANSWAIWDSMRGITDTSGSLLFPNLSNAELVSANYPISLSANGFQPRGTNSIYNASGRNYIYIAIRRGPMRQPTSGTEVFAMDTLYSPGNEAPKWDATMPVVDMAIVAANTSTTNNKGVYARLTQGKYLKSNTTDAEASTAELFDAMYGWAPSATSSGPLTTYPSWMFRRAPGFFDVVAYTGDGVAGRTVSHNLGVAPEMMIFKRRNGARSWAVYCQYVGNGYDKSGNLETTNPFYGGVWNNTLPTATEVTFNNSFDVNGSGATYIGYLFATLPGVSKVGSYTGNGTSQTIDCGFTSGARFILIKRTDSTGDWYIWDSARGIVAANDPHLSLNTTSAEVTTDDSVDPDSSGFIVNQVAATNINVSSASYIYLAIA